MRHECAQTTQLRPLYGDDEDEYDDVGDDVDDDDDNDDDNECDDNGDDDDDADGDDDNDYDDDDDHKLLRGKIQPMITTFSFAVMSYSP